MFVWGKEQQYSFEFLKQKLASALILQFLNQTKEFWIETDVNNIELGAMLT